MAATLFEMKENLSTLGAQMNKIDDQLAERAMDPSASAEDLSSLQGAKDTLQKRFDIVQNQYAEKEKEQKAHLTQQHQDDDPKERATHAYAALIRHTMAPSNSQFAQEFNSVKQALQDDTNSAGSSFLPENVSNAIIAEPFATNPLRDDETLTQIPNLILPRIAFETGDDTWDDVKDGDVAKELEAKGDQVKFGRFQTRTRAGISDTILFGSDAALVDYVNNALRSGLALKERSNAFATTPKPGKEHMSFYDETVVKIEKVSGEDMYDAIINAAADIDDSFQDNIEIYMRRSDYFAMIKQLSNGSSTLFGKQPEEVLGYPVKFTAAASVPVVGDFSYYQTNYDVHDAVYEQYKDHDKDINFFQVEAWADQQVKLASAFRLATVSK